MTKILRQGTIAITCFLFILPVTAQAEYYNHVNVNRYTQDDACWCAIANIEMISDWLEGSYSSTWSQQKVIAERYRVGEYTQGSQYSNGYTCLRDNGTQSGGLAISPLRNALQREVRDEKGITGFNFTEVTATPNQLITEIARHISWNKPIVLLGNTRYKNGKPPRNAGHYFVIDGLYSYTAASNGQDFKYAYGTTNHDKVSFVYLNDPAYYGAGTSNVESISPTTAISPSFLKSELAAKVNGYKHTFIKY